MSHRTRAEQFDVKARKDPKKLARKTRRHTPKNAYKRIRDVLREYENETDT